MYFIFMVKTYSFIKEYLLLLISLEIILLLLFMSLDFFVFYILFESILIPMFILIGIFGQENVSPMLLIYYSFIHLLDRF